MNHSCGCTKPVLNTVTRGPFHFGLDANTQEKHYLQAKRNAIQDLADKTYFLSILSEYYDCTRWPTSVDTIADAAKNIIDGNRSALLSATKSLPPETWVVASQLTAVQMTLYCNSCGLRIDLNWSIDKSNVRTIARSNPILNFRFCMTWCGLHYSEVILKVAHWMRTEQQARRDDLQQELCAFMPRDLIPAITRYIDWE
jgi:hypothetical protein